MNPQNRTTQSWRYDRQLLLLLISPSWISGFFCVLVSAAATIILLTQGQYEGSELQRQIFAWQSDDSGSLSQTIVQLRSSSLGEALGTIQVFIFWYVVGLILYVILTALYNVIRGIQEVKRDFGYANTTPRHILRGVFSQLARQLAALLSWLLWTILTLKIVIPYGFSAIQISNGYLPSLSAIGALLGITIGVAFCLHIHIVLIRLFLGRPRIWHSEAYIESLPHMN